MKCTYHFAIFQAHEMIYRNFICKLCSSILEFATQLGLLFACFGLWLWFICWLLSRFGLKKITSLWYYLAMAMYIEKWLTSVLNFGILERSRVMIWFAFISDHLRGIQVFFKKKIYCVFLDGFFVLLSRLELRWLITLQVLLTAFRSLPPLFEETPNAVHELTIASNIPNSILLPPFAVFSFFHFLGSY